MTIGLVATVKAPKKILMRFIMHHIALGVDHIVIFLDEPLQLEEWRDWIPDRVEFIACDDAYWRLVSNIRPDILADRQKLNVNYAKEILEKAHCEWLIHVDVDELIRPAGKIDLRTELQECEDDCYRFSLHEAVATGSRDYDYFSGGWFKKKPSLNRLRLLKLLGCGRVLQDGKYFRGHTASKCAVRICGRIGSFGVHYPVSKQGKLKIKKSKCIYLLHFDALNYDDWKAKAYDKRIEISLEDNPTLSEERKRQFRLFGELEKKDERAAYRLYLKLYALTPRQKWTLYLLGLLMYLPASKISQSNNL